MRQFLGLVLRVLIIIGVGLVSALTSMRLAIHGREISVPPLVNLTNADAQQAAKKAGLVLSFDEQFYSSEIPAGRIISQSPAAKTLVRRGSRVHLAESLGAQKITIPNVVGSSERAAEINLRRRGLEIGSVGAISLPSIPLDQVVAQSPPADAQGVLTRRVNLLINRASDGEMREWVMPDLSGMRLAEASVALTDAGLKVGRVSTVSTEVAGAPPSGAKSAPTEAYVVRQTPLPGLRVGPDTSVNLDVVRH